MKKALLFFCSLILAACFNGVSTKEEFVASTEPVYSEFLTILPEIDILDGGILSNEPCPAPCFYHITPGLTNHLDAKEKLYKLDQNGVCKETRYYDENSGKWTVGWVCSNISLTYNEATGLVNWIRFEPTVPITLQEIIVVHGSPDEIAVVQDGSYESPTTTSDIFYFTKNVFLPILTPIDGEEYIISPSTLISAVIYMDDNEMEYTTKVFSKDIVQWEGFKTYP